MNRKSSGYFAYPAWATSVDRGDNICEIVYVQDLIMDGAAYTD